ncbi:hypothetical protein SKTS_33200 [Sulfurimicrobium lacus]|uniref:Phage tail assembly protein n=1 Tax=Sulfurimicrobium lacus TaxID=2715678 RepID=A0A6F8VFI2_9PROT|nr:phage tail assembly protein [Sulfurimicrobium lacus]BCB28434.1 hypothetical protein SKTS_33200 [Sulfurimicrobium lacus]
MAKLTLKHPLTFGKMTVDSLTFRDYTTAGDYLAFDQRGGVAQRIALIASLTGSDESLIKQLRGPDYRAAEKIADDMINGDEAGDEEAAEKK